MLKVRFCVLFYISLGFCSLGQAECKSGGQKHGHIYCYDEGSDQLPKVLRSCPQEGTKKKQRPRFVLFSKSAGLLTQPDSQGNQVNQSHNGQPGFVAKQWDVFNFANVDKDGEPISNPVYINGATGSRFKKNYMFSYASQHKGYIGAKWLMPFNDNSGGNKKWKLSVGPELKINSTLNVRSKQLAGARRGRVSVTPECLKESKDGSLWVQVRLNGKMGYVLVHRKKGMNYSTVLRKGDLRVEETAVAQGPLYEDERTEAGTIFECKDCEKGVKKQAEELFWLTQPESAAERAPKADDGEFF